MKHLLMVPLIFSSVVASAAKFDQVYTLAKPPIVEPETAMRAALDGKTVYLCTTQEFKAGKSGKSGGLRNIKKPKTDDALNKAIEDLQDQKSQN